MFDSDRPSIPTAYADLMLDILDERGVAKAVALKRAEIDAARLRNVDGRISASEWARLSRCAMTLAEDEGLGIEYGLRQLPTAHGTLGYAVITSATLRDLLDTSAKYSRSRLSVYAIYLKEDGVSATLTVREKVPLGNLRNFFFECVLVGIAATVKFLFPDLFEQIELGFTWPQPDYFERYRDRLPKVNFRASDNQLRLPSSSLARKSLLANAAAHSQAIRQLDREMALLNLDASDLVDRVRAGLMLSEDGYPSLARLASSLFLSERTLKRRLREHGTSYREMLEKARYRDACALLRETDLSLADVSAKLGYQNPPTFTRAFRRWSGIAPSRYRDTL
ncbi:AraC family transcriptional regulator [Burkholderia oklahomensis]|uniref:AraC family transcriptional regulator n=1 Tax=Burkholderia oklahomensis TaxID=342113 RepID=UPI00016A75A2|nr:AraC family transcriptional regulator [Burkholderia oklahomensis]AJX35314.1 helix-turn-helix domain protein [Burkholderia oklahomensis C6786]AOI48275.1 AraC family transcriptional regulator [Burkholderia oklahomensis C6786]KUY52583.1 AraC family transcriptional regulator [Burkholderia oklahomensis C6786]MBI0363581.1 AraC family transcriptional regulator ligand-binding domain-containing protein [Burkholderia oklahomensis]SUY27702.1 HTH-type transcriptional regulator gadX [Burkholderia oklaho